ncbi:MAG: MFS transporter [Steroidobacter sp.]
MSQPSFAALRHSGFRMFFIGNATAMLADNMEHVISYWVLNDTFHMPALGGVAVISHWLPYLLISFPVGHLTDRFDPRRMIQFGMLLFMSVSLMWGILFTTHTLQIWHAVVLLIIHGVAGVFWTAPAQVLVHDIVGSQQLQSAVRSNASARYIGTMLGPAVGSTLMLLVTPAHAMFINMLIYLPMLLWLWRAPYGPKFRKGDRVAYRPMNGFGDVLSTLRVIAKDRINLSMILLAGFASFFIGTAYQAQMPAFAHALGHGDPGLAYSMLLGADAAGALVAGFILESHGLLHPKAGSALLLASVWCVALASFALTSTYAVAVPSLFVAGFMELSFGAMAQTIVQMHAPAEIRGRVIGVFVMAAMGMRTFSGTTVGLLGQKIGIHYSLSFSAAMLFVVIVAISMWSGRQRLVSE